MLKKTMIGTLITMLICLSLQTLAEVDLQQLHDSLKASHTNPQEYKISKLFVFNTVDNRDGVVCSAYTPLECKKYHESTLGKNNSFNMNTEHTWPQSKGAKYFPAQGDLHHLYATSKESNSERANYPFCHVIESFWEKQGSAQGYDEQLRDCFEPADSHKGNVARAMFYFSIRYLLPLTIEQEVLFRSWNTLDPVDENEMIRNDRIEKIQGNRNPFIDDQSLIESISTFQFKLTTDKKH